jgi:hypothetical protein
MRLITMLGGIAIASALAIWLMVLAESLREPAAR